MRNIFSIWIILLFYSCSNTETDNVFAEKRKDTFSDTNKYEPVPPVGLEANNKLRAELEEIYNSDQGIRYKYIDLEKKHGRESMEVKRIIVEWRIIDSVNCVKVVGILDKYGWVGTYEVGEQGNSTLFLVIQHSDIKIQEKYLPMMRKAVMEHKAEASQLALLEDRVLLEHGKKQLYGSQIEQDPKTGIYKISPIDDEPNVNRRRDSMGLGPLEEYAKQWEIKYTLPKK